MTGTDSFNYDLYEAMLHGNFFERVFHRGRVKTILNLMDYSGKKVLDLGCNTGIILMPLLQRGVDVVGVDINVNDITQAKRNLEGKGLDPSRVQVAAGADLPFADATFDLVLLIDVLEHVSDPIAVTSEIRRVLRPGGLVVATVPFHLHPHVRYPFVRKLLTGRSNVDEDPDIPFTLGKFKSCFPGFELLKHKLVFFWVCILGIFKKK